MKEVVILDWIFLCGNGYVIDRLRNEFGGLLLVIIIIIILFSVLDFCIKINKFYMIIVFCFLLIYFVCLF